MNIAKRILPILGGLAVVLPGLAVSTAPSAPAAPLPPAQGNGEVVLKVANDLSCSFDTLAATYDIEAVSTVLASRRVALVRSTDPTKWTDSKADELAKKLKTDDCVAYAERDREVELADERYHAWPDGQSRPANPAEWKKQPAAWKLQLKEARKLSTGAGIKVAVLDTGVDSSHPALEGVVVPGYDYVDDDADPYDEAGGTVSGHGTFVAGLVHLVAPGATVVSMRVLDAEGEGDGYVIAEAIYDAVQMGVKVVNLSLGTVQKLESKVLNDMVKWARTKGTLTTAAAGNDGTEAQHWPAAQAEVLSVAAFNQADRGLAWYSTRGGWVDFGAVGTKLISLMPGGGYDAWSGTSMAAPVVAGQVALIVAANPRLDVAHIEEAIRATSRKIDGVKLHYGGIDILASVQRALR